MDKARIEQQLLELPLFQYDWMETSELVFSERVRWICQTQCPMYNTTWACPPAVGTVEECKARCLSYPHALMMTSITEVSDIANLEETLATRAPHEALTRQVRDMIAEQSSDVMALSTEACAICQKCAYPDAPCRHPDPDVPLRGISGHSGHGPCRKARSGFYERQYRRLVLADSIQVSMRAPAQTAPRHRLLPAAQRCSAIAPPIGSVSA